MAKYEKGFNFNSPEELRDYIDWVAEINHASPEDAFNAIIEDGSATLGGKRLGDMIDADGNTTLTDDVLLQIFPEYKPNKFEQGYVEPKSLGETMGDKLIEGVKDDITKWPERQLWKAISGGYYDGKNFNTDKILKNVGKGGSKKVDDKKTEDVKNDDNKGGTEEKSGEKTSSGLLKFGKDTTSIEQIENRDKQLAKIFNEKGIDDISKVEDFLNHYDTFKEASSENKQRTIKRIYDNIKNLQKEEETKKKSEGPQWIYIDQEDYKGTPEAKEGLDMYNKYAQVEAEKGDSSKVFKQMMGEAPTSHNVTAIRNKLKDAGLSTAQINDFQQAWADAYYKVDNDSPINDVKEIKKPTQVSLKKSQKNTDTKSNNNNKGKKINIVKGSETIKNLLKNKK